MNKTVNNSIKVMLPELDIHQRSYLLNKLLELIGEDEPKLTSYANGVMMKIENTNRQVRNHYKADLRTYIREFIEG